MIRSGHSTETVTVRAGDTLSGIAARYGLSWVALAQRNRAVIGDNPDLIFPDDALVIRNGEPQKSPDRVAHERALALLSPTS